MTLPWRFTAKTARFKPKSIEKKTNKIASMAQVVREYRLANPTPNGALTSE